MKRQLDPTYETLKEYLQVDFYPFGKADVGANIVNRNSIYNWDHISKCP